MRHDLWAYADVLHAHTNTRVRVRVHTQENTRTHLLMRHGLCGLVQVCRTTLLPAALKTLGANKDAALPIKLFEVRI